MVAAGIRRSEWTRKRPTAFLTSHHLAEQKDGVAMNFRQIMLHHPHRTFIPLIGFLSAFANSSTIPLVLTLTALLLYFRILLPSPHAARHFLLLSLSLSIGRAVPHLLASIHALSTVGVSLVALFVFSAITSILALAAVFIDTKLCMRLNSSWAQITLFPALWATLWCTVAYTNPLGHLSTWSLNDGSGAYRWLVPFFGPVSQDWVVAAWAVVCSKAVEAWFIFESPTLLPIDEHADSLSDIQSSLSSHSHLLLVLMALSIPSFLLNLPLPVSTISTSTPLTVGCVLPPFQRYQHHSLTLDDYISESRKLQNSAKFLLWPEGAVSFNSEAERDAGFEQVRKSITSYVGVSFEETFTDPRDPNGSTGLKRTGIAVMSNSSASPYLFYYKRHLVPIAESFSLTHSPLPPGVFDAVLYHPKDISPSKWAPGPNHTRSVPITTSICLDFAAASPFSDLKSRPALVLAPARTWDLSIGYAMWLQAKQRAEELGTIVLWCDGGKGGVSGVAGGGYSEIVQVGTGSWIKTVGIPYPFNDRRTLYAQIGDIALLLFWAFVFGRFSLSPFSHFSALKSPVLWIWTQAGRSSKAVSQRAVRETSPLLVDL